MQDVDSTSLFDAISPLGNKQMSNVMANKILSNAQRNRGTGNISDLFRQNSVSMTGLPGKITRNNSRNAVSPLVSVNLKNHINPSGGQDEPMVPQRK